LHIINSLSTTHWYWRWNSSPTSTWPSQTQSHMYQRSHYTKKWSSWRFQFESGITVLWTMLPTNGVNKWGLMLWGSCG